MLYYTAVTHFDAHPAFGRCLANPKKESVHFELHSNPPILKQSIPSLRTVGWFQFKPQGCQP
jgi:hypothetical protein